MARRKEIERHLSSEELDDAIDTAQSEGDAYLVRRLTFVKNLYQGDSANEAGERVGVSSATASRWVRAWNDDGVEGLHRSFSSGRPSKLSEEQRDRLKSVLEDHQPLTTAEVQQLIEEAFDVSYSKRHVSRLLRKLGLTYAIPRPEHGDRPDDADDRLEQRLDDALAELEDDDLTTDGGAIVGFSRRGVAPADRQLPPPVGVRHPHPPQRAADGQLRRCSHGILRVERRERRRLQTGRHQGVGRRILSI